MLALMLNPLERKRVNPKTSDGKTANRVTNEVAVGISMQLPAG
jgi:hypothetical protein